LQGSLGTFAGIETDARLRSRSSPIAPLGDELTKFDDNATRSRPVLATPGSDSPFALRHAVSRPVRHPLVQSGDKRVRD
jgi:hypothetical protein